MTRKECADHALWQNNLMAAFWVVVALTWYLLLFTEGSIGTLLAIIVSFVLFIVRNHLDKKHAKWHIQQNEGDLKEHDRQK